MKLEIIHCSLDGNICNTQSISQILCFLQMKSKIKKKCNKKVKEKSDGQDKYKNSHQGKI